MERPKTSCQVGIPLNPRGRELGEGTSSLVHCSHLKLYAVADLLHQTVELEKMSAFLEHEAFPVRKFCDLRKNVEEMTREVLCTWRGFADEESTWEPVAVMKMDTPERFLANSWTGSKIKRWQSKCALLDNGRCCELKYS
jgi:hypothetical protein